MNLVYVLAVKEDKSVCPSYGVYKKVLAQVEALNNLGISAKLYEAPMISKYLRVFPFATSSVIWRKIPVDIDTDILYIRHCFIDFQLILELKRLKRKNRKIRIVLEIPSYPYSKESRKLAIKPLRDSFYSRYLHKYCDRIVTYSPDKIIFGIHTIQLVNGINISSVSEKKTTGCESINMCVVANLATWHGIDRLIKGMKTYYNNGGTRELFLSVIGADTPTLSMLKELVKKTSLCSRIEFKGALIGNELDKEYDKINLGVECLAMFRKGDNLISSSLKSREYLAKGIPFIYSGRIDVIKDDFKYALALPESEEEISIDNVISFFDDIYSNETESQVIHEIHSFAENNVSMAKTLGPLVEYFHEKK